MDTTVSPFDRLAAGKKRFPDLTVEVDPVGDDYHSWIYDRRFQRQRLGKHYHRQAFAATGRMPDDATRSLLVSLRFGDSCQGFADGKILLVTGNLFYVFIEDNVAVRHFQKSIRPEQAVEQPVLRRWQNGCPTPGISFILATTSGLRLSKIRASWFSVNGVLINLASFTSRSLA